MYRQVVNINLLDRLNCFNGCEQIYRRAVKTKIEISTEWVWRVDALTFDQDLNVGFDSVIAATIFARGVSFHADAAASKTRHVWYG